MLVHIWVIHTGPKSGGELVTLFGSNCDESVNAGMWVRHIGPKSEGKLVTLFDRYCDDSDDIYSKRAQDTTNKHCEWVIS